MFDHNEGNIGTKNKSPSRVRNFLLGFMIASIFSVLAIGVTSSQNSIATTQEAGTSQSPTDGYDIHVTVNRHDSENLDAPMNHYCKLDTKIVAVCQLYAGEGADAQLAQVEFIITADQYAELPSRDKQNWHNHAVELTPERGSPAFVSLPPGINGTELLTTLQGTYSKVVTLWDPSDDLPDYPPYVFAVDSPFALGQDTNNDLAQLWETGDASSSGSDNESSSGSDNESSSN